MMSQDLSMSPNFIRYTDWPNRAGKSIDLSRVMWFTKLC